MSVRIEKNGVVTTVILHRPEAKNAVDGPTGAALTEARINEIQQPIQQQGQQVLEQPVLVDIGRGAAASCREAPRQHAATRPQRLLQLVGHPRRRLVCLLYTSPSPRD